GIRTLRAMSSPTTGALQPVKFFFSKKYGFMLSGPPRRSREEGIRFSIMPPGGIAIHDRLAVQCHAVEVTSLPSLPHGDKSTRILNSTHNSTSDKYIAPARAWYNRLITLKN